MHLIRNPFHNTVARFHLERRNMIDKLPDLAATVSVGRDGFCAVVPAPGPHLQWQRRARLGRGNAPAFQKGAVPRRILQVDAVAQSRHGNGALFGTTTVS